MALRKCKLTLFCILNDRFVPPKSIETNKSSLIVTRVRRDVSPKKTVAFTSIKSESQAILGLPNRHFPKRTVGSPYSVESNGNDRGKNWNYGENVPYKHKGLLVTSPAALPLSYRRLVGGKVIKLGSCDKRPAYCWD